MGRTLESSGRGICFRETQPLRKLEEVEEFRFTLMQLYGRAKASLEFWIPGYPGREPGEIHVILTRRSQIIFANSSRE